MASLTHGQMMLFHKRHAVILFVKAHLYVVATVKYHDLLLYKPEPSPSSPPPAYNAFALWQESCRSYQYDLSSPPNQGLKQNLHPGK